MAVEQKGQQLAAEYNLLAQLADEIQKDIALLQNLLTEVESALASVKHIKDLSGEEEVLVPLSAGVYARGRIKGQEKFIVSIGSNILVEKGSEETIKFLEERREEIRKHIEKRSEELNKVLARLEEIRRKVAASR